MFSGAEIGSAIKTGGKSMQQKASSNSPVRRAYELYNNFRGRSSWDQTAVLYAVRGLNQYWSAHTEGYNHVFPDGSNEWRSSPDKNHNYLKPKTPPRKLADLIDNLMIQSPNQ
jgi:hypothetical protein